MGFLLHISVRDIIYIILNHTSLNTRDPFQIPLFIIKFLNGPAPTYLSLWSIRSCLELKTKLRGDRAFSVIAPKLWNSLPLCVRTAQSVSNVKPKLKTHVFFGF